MIDLALKMIHLTVGHSYKSIFCKTDSYVSNTTLHVKTQTHSPCERSLKWPETRSSLLSSSSSLRGRERICWRISANLFRKEYEHMNIVKDTSVLPSDSYISATYQIIPLQPPGRWGLGTVANLKPASAWQPQNKEAKSLWKISPSFKSPDSHL